MDDALQRQVQEQLGGYDLPPVASVKIELNEDTKYVRIANDVALGPEDGSDDAVIGYERLHRALESAVHQHLTETVTNAMDRCSTILNRLDAGAERMQRQLDISVQQLCNIRADL